MAVASDLFTDLPDTARLWVFGVSRPLEPAEASRLLATVDGFLGQWKAHGHPLSASREWVHGRFLLVAVDDRVEPPSGCSIDALVGSLRELEEELDVEILGSAPIWYLVPGAGDLAEGDWIRRVTRSEFRELARDGAVDSETVVFDPSITRVVELREGRWKRPAGEGWHRSYLP